MERDNQKRIYQLAAKLCDAEATEAELTELGCLLDGNTQAIREYLDFTGIDFHLQSKLWTSPAMASQLESDPSPAHPITPQRARQIVHQSPRRKSRPLLLWVLAASLLVASLALLQSLPANDPFVARITEQVDCDWSASRWGIPAQPKLSTGRVVKFQHGLMELEFGKGARVMLEGPAQFKITSNNSVRLELGRLCATVPTSATGFTVRTPFTEVVDLGTRFGVVVNKEGICETHVFQGKVVVQDGLADQGLSEVLQAQQALRVSRSGDGWEKLPAVPTSFLGHTRLASHGENSRTPSLGIDPNRSLKLWLRSDAGLELDSAQRVVYWRDQVPDEQIACDAWQLNASRRPKLIAEGNIAYPAIRFDGTNDLSTRPFSVGKNLSLICVVDNHEGLRHPFPQRLLQLGTQNAFVLDRPAADSLAGSLLLSLGGTKLQAGYLACADFDSRGPIVCAYTYSSSAEQAQLLINGELVGTTDVAEMSIDRAPLTLGGLSGLAHGFTGDFYELMFFDSALVMEECQSISKQLVDRYGIESTLCEPRVLSGLRTSGQ